MADNVTPINSRMPLNKLVVPAAASIRPRPWLYGYWFMRGAVTLIVAPGGTGKTALLTAAILACATGQELIDGIKPLRPLTVAFLGLEESEEEMHRRFAAAMLHYGIKEEDYAGRVYYLDGRKYAFSAAWLDGGGNVQESPQMLELTMWLQMIGVDVLLADPLALAHSAPENDNTAMARVLSYFSALAAACDCGVGLIHHTRKGAVAGDPDAIRGAGALVNHARIAIGLSAIGDDDAKLFNITRDEAKRLVRVDDLKLNYSPKAIEARWVKLESVRLGNQDADYPHGDSVQVATHWAPPEPVSDLSVEVANQILDEFDGGKDGERYSTQRNAALPAHLLVQSIMAMHGVEKSDAWCRQLIGLWLKAQPPVLYQQDYRSEAQRKTRKGLFVNAQNRPGDHGA